MPITMADVLAARRRIAGQVHRTPLIRSASLSQRTGTDVWLKMEHQQITGAFKLRGATNAILSLNPEARERGVVAVSTGNHGRGLSHAAKAAGVHAAICMSELVPANKVEAIRALGADVRIVGRSQDEAEVEARRLVDEDHMTMVSPFDTPPVIAGQGTIGLEIAEDLPDVRTVLVPLSGGGLISGIALAIKTLAPSARVVGITMEDGAAMYESQKAGHPVEVEEVKSLADSLGGGIGLDNAHTFPMVRRYVDDMVLVSEAEIADGIRHAYREERQVIEGGAAVGLAAILADKVKPDGPVVVVLSGANIDMDLHRRIVTGEADGP